MYKAILYGMLFMLACSLHSGSESGPDQKQKGIAWLLTYTPSLQKSSVTPGSFADAAIPEGMLPKLAELLDKSSREVAPPSAPLQPVRSHEIRGIGSDFFSYNGARVDLIDVRDYMDRSKPMNTLTLRTFIVLCDTSIRPSREIYVENDAFAKYVKVEFRQKVLALNPDVRKRYGLDENGLPLIYSGKFIRDANGNVIPNPLEKNADTDRQAVPDKLEANGKRNEAAHKDDKTPPE